MKPRFLVVRGWCVEASNVQEALDATKAEDGGAHTVNVIRLPPEYANDPTPAYRVIPLPPHTLP